MNDPVKPPRDQTGPVMRRLGLPRITPRDARHRRRRRAVLRVAICLAVTGAVALVGAVTGRAAPRAADPTIPSAIAKCGIASALLMSTMAPSIPAQWSTFLGHP